MAPLYADENFNRRVIDALGRLGHDVLTAHQAGQANQKVPDPLVLTFATAHGRAVLTYNRRHFVGLHQQMIQGGGSHSGIIACTVDNDVAALALRIHQAITSLPSLANQLVNIRQPPSPPPPSVP